MPDNLYKTGNSDDIRINLTQAHEVRYWQTALDCTEEQLRGAVALVGPLVTDVRTHLRSKK
jgi:hypothetical protein